MVKIIQKSEELSMKSIDLSTWSIGKKPILIATKLWRSYKAPAIHSAPAANKKAATSFLPWPAPVAGSPRRPLGERGRETDRGPLLPLAQGRQQRQRNRGACPVELGGPVNMRREKGGEGMYKFPDAFLMRKFVNLLMVAGKKSVAYKIFSAAGFEFLQSIEKGHKIQSVAALFSVQRAQEEKQVPGGVLKKNQHTRFFGKTAQNALRGEQPKRLKKKRIKKREKANIEQRNATRFQLKMRTVIKNVQPSVEGRKCRMGRSHKWVPAIVPHERGCSLAMRWIIESARKRKKNNKLPMHRCLAQEFLEAYQRIGRPRQRRDELHKLCEGNRGFLRYRWW